MNQHQKRLLDQKLKLQRGAAIIDELQSNPGAAVLEHVQDAFRADGYSNLLNKYGTPQDNSTAYQFDQEVISDDLKLIRLYEGNGLFTKIIDRPSEEAVKHGLDIDYGDEDTTEYVESRLDDLDFEQQFATAEKWARLYGGSIIVMLVDDGRGLEEPLDWKNVRSIEELRVFERAVVQPDYTSMNQFSFADSLEEGRPFGEPEYYQVFSVYGYFIVHRTRCLVFRNGRLPEQTTNAIYRYWGIPEYVKIKRALRECITSHEDGVKLMERSVQAIYKMKNLANMLSTDDGENKVLQRLQIIDMARGILNSIAIDNDGEDYDFKNFSTTGVKEVIDSTCNMLSAVTNIPQTVLFGRSPAGMNATGESDLENYYNMVENIQKQNMKRNVRTLLDLILKQGVLEGKIEEVPKYKVKFAALWSMSDSEKATVDKTKADTERTRAATAQAYIDAGIIDPSEVRHDLVNEGYLGIESDELPNDTLNLPMDEPETDLTRLPEEATNIDEDNRRETRKAAAVLVIKDGKVLCADRLDRKGICGPGGHIKAGEKADEAASREAYEEFNVYPLNLIPLGEMKASTGLYLTTTLYLCDRFTGTPKADGVEMANERWATIPELLGGDPYLFPAFGESLAILRSILDPYIGKGRKDGTMQRRQTRTDSAYDEWLEDNTDKFESVKAERDFANWKNDDGFRPRDATDVDEVDMAWSEYQKHREDGGPGSGNFGHGGRPGEVGGSAPSGITSVDEKYFPEEGSWRRDVNQGWNKERMKYLTESGYDAEDIKKFDTLITSHVQGKSVDSEMESFVKEHKDLVMEAASFEYKAAGIRLEMQKELVDKEIKHIEDNIAEMKAGEGFYSMMSKDDLEWELEKAETNLKYANHARKRLDDEPITVYRKGGYDDPVLSFTTDRDGVVLNPGTDNEQWLSPDHSSTLEDLIADGIVPVGGFGAFYNFYGGEGSEVTFVKVGNSTNSDGGPGSGNFGHEGRPGKVGGSAEGESGGSHSTPDGTSSEPGDEKNFSETSSKIEENTLYKSQNSDKIVIDSPNGDGGPGSGNHEHEGVPGQVGGSAPSGGGDITRFERADSKVNVTSEIEVKLGRYGKATMLVGELSDVSDFAGVEGKKAVMVEEHLINQYGGTAGSWRHTKGVGAVRLGDGTETKAELHWFENDDVGQIKWKVKKFVQEE